MRNGIPAAGLSELAHEVAQHPEQGMVKCGVKLNWLSGMRSQVSTLPMQIGDQHVNRDFQWLIDEPKQFGGSNHAANPQEYLLSGFGSCLMAVFICGASTMGIQLSTLHIEVRSSLDFAGFLGIKDGDAVPLQGIHYVIHVAGDGTPEQFETLRQQAQAHSPNAMSLAHGVPVTGEIRVHNNT